MGITTANMIAGIYSVTLNGVPIGSTTREGIAMKTTFTTYKVKSAQALASPKRFRTDAERMISFTMNEWSLEAENLLLDGKNSIVTGPPRTLSLGFTSDLTEMSLLIAGPGPTGKGEVYAATVTVAEVGDLVLSIEKEIQRSITVEEVPTVVNGKTTFGEWTESTADTTPPTFTSDPEDEDVDVAIDTTIVLTASEALDTATVIADNFALLESETGDPVALNAPVWSGPAKTVTLTPSSSLTNLTTYTILATKAITDTSGNHLAAPFTATFTTIAGT